MTTSDSDSSDSANVPVRFRPVAAPLIMQRRLEQALLNDYADDIVMRAQDPEVERLRLFRCDGPAAALASLHLGPQLPFLHVLERSS